MADLGPESLNRVLPDEVTMEILSRVPPESLVRFKRVSKSWYALINDSKFGRSLQNQSLLLKRVVNNKETGKNEIRLSFLKYPLAITADDDDDTSVSVEVEDVHFPFSSFGEKFQNSRINGHSHGLVCLTVNTESVFLYNPVTGEFRELPPSILDIPQSGYSHDFNEIQSLAGGIGFGYDPKSMDLKVVRIVEFVPPGTDLYDYGSVVTYLPARAEVYDLKKDEWREIETPVPGRLRSTWEPWYELYYQGFYYWWAESNSKELGVRRRIAADIIMWFDMSEEVFGQIPLPESLYENGRIPPPEYFPEEEDEGYIPHTSIQVLNGSIVISRYSTDYMETSLEVWEMVKLGGVVSWSKMFRVSPVFQLEHPVAFVSSNQLLIDTVYNYQETSGGRYPGQLILYNINTQEFKNLSLESIAGMTQAFVFVKTLLSVNRGHIL